MRGPMLAIATIATTLFVVSTLSTATASGSRGTNARPNLVVILADDLGWYDTAVTNPASPTPSIASLAKEGLLLERHYVFRYCSPTRRSFLSGRFPNHLTTVQPDHDSFCSDFLPLNLTTLAQKLAGAEYKNHFVGKGHLGYETTDHLPINRGFDSHVGYLLGAQNYSHGIYKDKEDMWESDAPAPDVCAAMNYSADWYTARAISIIEAHAQGTDASSPLFMYFAIQNVHSPYTLPPSWEVRSYPQMWDQTYANMLHMLDSAVANLTQALKAQSMWDNTLILFTADNGGMDRGNNYPLRGHKHDAWEGGTRATAFLSGGFLPASVRGTTSGAKFVHVADWYPTFCTLAGVDPSDPAFLDGAARPIDGVDVWPLLTGVNLTQPRALTPTTEASIVDTSDPTKWWKLINLAGISNYYTKNQKTVKSTDMCLAECQKDPPQPGPTDPIVNGCPVCNLTSPCLYDVLADPEERNNVASSHSDVVARLQNALEESLKSYVTGHLPADQLARDYTKVPDGQWGDFAGPCYERKGDLHT